MHPSMEAMKKNNENADLEASGWKNETFFNCLNLSLIHFPLECRAAFVTLPRTDLESEHSLQATRIGDICLKQGNTKV